MVSGYPAHSGFTDFQIYGNQEIYIPVNPDIRESRNEYATT